MFSSVKKAKLVPKLVTLQCYSYITVGSTFYHKIKMFGRKKKITTGYVASGAPPLRSTTIYEEQGFISKPVNRKYVLKPTLFTRLKNFYWKVRGRKLAAYGAPPKVGLFGKAKALRSRLRLGKTATTTAYVPTSHVPALRPTVMYEEEGYIPKAVNRKYVFKPTLLTQAKDLVNR